MKEIKRNIILSWIERTVEDTERVGAMYCFNRCDVNVN